MNETQFSVAGIILLISMLCVCASETTFESLATAQVVASDGSGENGGEHSKGPSAEDADDDADETCDAEKYADPKTIVLCAVSDVDDDEPRQVCTDAGTAVSKYGLDPAKPNLIGSAGDHLGAC